MYHPFVSSNTTKFRKGVLHGDEVTELLNYAKDNEFALPAVNVIGSHSCNAALQAAKEVNSPIIIQVSNGGARFFAGKLLENDVHQAEIAGAVSFGLHVHNLAELYGVTVILHSDHAARKLLPWVDGMIDADERYFEMHDQPLFSSHMLDLSEESLEDNVQTSKQYMQRMSAIGMTTEVEIGITGGEEDGVDNSDVDNAKLYTQPEDVLYTYQELSSVSDRFTIAAAFGNVHGVYKPGNVDLHPEILNNSQKYISERLGLRSDVSITWDPETSSGGQEDGFSCKPVNFVFHGGSGSDPAKITEAIGYGAVKMNIDTDTQWAFCEGVRTYMDENKDYLRGQIGNPEGPDMPNKKKYDPRAWQIEGEKSMTKRLIQAFEDLNCLGVND